MSAPLHRALAVMAVASKAVAVSAQYLPTVIIARQMRTRMYGVDGMNGSVQMPAGGCVRRVDGRRRRRQGVGHARLPCRFGWSRERRGPEAPVSGGGRPQRRGDGWRTNDAAHVVLRYPEGPTFRGDAQRPVELPAVTADRRGRPEIKGFQLRAGRGKRSGKRRWHRQ